MALTAERLDHDALVLTQTSQSAPRARRLPAILFALLGYTYLVGLLAFVSLCALLVLLIARWQVAVWFLIPICATIALIVQTIRVSLPEPEGIVLSRNDAGLLFAATDELRLAFRTPALGEILLTDEFAVRIVQQPRLGLLGWYRQTLLIGLPLLQALSWDQIRALLAREFALAAGAPGRPDGWLRRRRLLWGRLLEQLDGDQPWWHGAIAPFFRWYVPRFLAYSAPLVAVQDLAADHAAAGIVGARQAADALLYQGIVGRFLDHEFWPGLYRQIAVRPDPPEPYRLLGVALLDASRSPGADEWLATALHATDNPVGGAITLAERLATLGQEARVPPSARPAAGQVFVSRLHLAIDDMDRTWREAIGPAWRDQHLYARNTIQALHKLDEAALNRELTPDEALQRARWTEEFGSPAEALTRYREALSLAPSRAEVAFAVGRLLLACGDGDGLSMLDRAMHHDPERTLPACALAVPFLTSRGRVADAETYRQRAHRRVQLLQSARAERQGVRRADTLMPHDLPPDSLAWITGNLATRPAVSAAYLARKEVTHLPERAVYLLAIALDRPRHPFHFWRGDRQHTDALARILAPIAAETDTYLVIPLDPRNTWLRIILDHTPHSAIYHR